MAALLPPAPPVPAAPAPVPPPPPSKIAKMDGMTKNTMRLPYAERPLVSLTFGKLDSDYRCVERVLQIDAQDTIAGMVYDQMDSVRSINLPITRANFIQTWKTLILKRVQDVQERGKGVKPPHFVRINRAIPIPAPLADLLHSIGNFHSDAHGAIFHTVQPAQAAVPEAWWTVNNANIANWIRACSSTAPMYQMSEFPSPSEVDERPMMLLTRDDQGVAPAPPTVSVRSWTNETKLTDALVFVCNDPLYDVHGHITYANCHLNACSNIDIPGTRHGYVASYVLDSHA